VLSIDGEQSCVRRVMELGLVPGTLCTLERKAPFGGPIEVSIGTIRLGMRLGSELRIMIAGAE
jgi:Fe2+ transport system protein FeoA